MPTHRLGLVVRLVFMAAVLLFLFVVALFADGRHDAVLTPVARLSGLWLHPATCLELLVPQHSQPEVLDFISQKADKFIILTSLNLEKVNRN